MRFFVGNLLSGDKGSLSGDNTRLSGDKAATSGDNYVPSGDNQLFSGGANNSLHLNQPNFHQKFLRNSFDHHAVVVDFGVHFLHRFFVDHAF